MVICIRCPRSSSNFSLSLSLSLSLSFVLFISNDCQKNNSNNKRKNFYTPDQCLAIAVDCLAKSKNKEKNTIEINVALIYFFLNCRSNDQQKAKENSVEQWEKFIFSFSLSLSLSRTHTVSDTRSFYSNILNGKKVSYEKSMHDVVVFLPAHTTILNWVTWQLFLSDFLVEKQTFDGCVCVFCKWEEKWHGNHFTWRVREWVL